MPRGAPLRGILVGAIVGVILGLLGITGCGKRGNPVVPRAKLPRPVSDLRATVRDRTVILTWSRPARYEDGTPLRDLEAFVILRRDQVVPGKEPAPAAEAGAFLPIATVPAEDPPNATVQGSLYAFRDDDGGRGIRPGIRFTYRIEAVTRQGYSSPPSREVTAEVIPSLQPPTGLRATPADGGVELQWEAPGAMTDGSPARDLRGYNIYRSERPGRHGRRPLTGEPVAGTTFRDPGSAEGKTYYYVVRAVEGQGPPWRETPDSNEVEVAIPATLPPSAPRGLEARLVDGAVQLAWVPNPEPEVRGYLVYRRVLPDAIFYRMMPEPIRETSYLDRQVARGNRYAYVVTAVDATARANESPPSLELLVTLP